MWRASGQPPFAETFAGGAWQVADVGTAPGRLNAVTCTAPGSCIAVGSDSSGDLAETLRSGSWSKTALDVQFGLDGISCASATFCVAVGGTTANNGLDSWHIGSATYSGGAWSTQNPTLGGDLSSVSCPTTGTCTAVGRTYDEEAGIETPVAYQLTNGTWRYTALPRPTDYSLLGTLSSISCASASQCVAVGGYQGRLGGTLGMAQVLDDGTWWATTVTPTDGLRGIDCLIATTCQSIGEGIGTTKPWVNVTIAVGGRGYLEAGSDGGMFTFGSAAFWGSTGGMTLDARIVGMAPTPDGGGYWLVAADGGVFSFGDAQFYGSLGGLKLVAPIVGIAATPGGRGYWLVAADGGVFTFGDAPFLGSMGGRPLSAPIVGMAASVASGGVGYWLVAADGGVFTFGVAPFYGSTGNLHLTAPVVGMAGTPTANGYWLVAADGGIFTFGSAQFDGSMGGRPLVAPITAMAATSDGGGYRLFASDGGVFTFGDATFMGSMGGVHLGPRQWWSAPRRARGVGQVHGSGASLQRT